MCRNLNVKWNLNKINDMFFWVVDSTVGRINADKLSKYRISMTVTHKENQ